MRRPRYDNSTYNSRRRGSSSKSRWEPEYCSRGEMSFNINGYVQKITEDGDNERDFVKFIVDNPYAEGNYNEISIQVPWDGFPQLKEGDKVNVFGMIRSWFNGEGKQLSYSFVAEQIEVVTVDKEKEKPIKKTRRGFINPLEEE